MGPQAFYSEQTSRMSAVPLRLLSASVWSNTGGRATGTMLRLMSCMQEISSVYTQQFRGLPGPSRKNIRFGVKLQLPFLTYSFASLVQGSWSHIFLESGVTHLDSWFNRVIEPEPSVAVDLPWILDPLDHNVNAVTEHSLSIGATKMKLRPVLLLIPRHHQPQHC